MDLGVKPTNDLQLSFQPETVILEGERSYEADVKSGVPQESILGPCLFLLYINDLPESLNCTMKLFADDIIAYLAITSEEDATSLQQDLSKLGKWETKWQMEFHPGKCQVLTITHNRNPVHNTYTLHGQALEHVTAAKYLGVTLTSDLSWNKHITNITGMANSSLGFLRHNLRINSPPLKTTAYKTLL